jgi:hypothetical protein
MNAEAKSRRREEKRREEKRREEKRREEKRREVIQPGGGARAVECRIITHY